MSMPQFSEMPSFLSLTIDLINETPYLKTCILCHHLRKLLDLFLIIWSHCINVHVKFALGTVMYAI